MVSTRKKRQADSTPQRPPSNRGRPNEDAPQDKRRRKKAPIPPSRPRTRSASPASDTSAPHGWARSQSPASDSSSSLGRRRSESPACDATLVGSGERWASEFDLLVEFQANNRRELETALVNRGFRFDRRCKSRERPDADEMVHDVRHTVFYHLSRDGLKRLTLADWCRLCVHCRRLLDLPETALEKNELEDMAYLLNRYNGLLLPPANAPLKTKLMLLRNSAADAHHQNKIAKAIAHKHQSVAIQPKNLPPTMMFPATKMLPATTISPATTMSPATTLESTRVVPPSLATPPILSRAHVHSSPLRGLQPRPSSCKDAVLGSKFQVSRDSPFSPLTQPPPIRTEPLADSPATDFTNLSHPSLFSANLNQLVPTIETRVVCPGFSHHVLQRVTKTHPELVVAKHGVHPSNEKIAFRSSACSFHFVKERAHQARCRSCASACGNFTKARNKETHEASTQPMNNLTPKRDLLEGAFRKMCNDFNRNDVVCCQSDKVRWLHQMMRLSHPTVSMIVLHQLNQLRMCLRFCSQPIQVSPNCKGHWITMDRRNRIQRENGFASCNDCTNEIARVKKHENRKVIDKGNRLAASSKTPTACLSPESKRSRMENIQKELKKCKRKSKTLKKLLDSKRKMVAPIPFTKVLDADGNNTGEEQSELLQCFERVMEHLQKTVGEENFREMLVKSMLNSPNRDDLNKDAANETTEVILSEIDNFKCAIENKPKQVRFHPSIVRLATNLHRSSPSACVDLQRNTPFAMPSESLMKKNKSERSASEGKNVRVFLTHSVAHDKKAKERDRVCLGHLACDELKLKSGIWFRLSTHELVGFSDDHNSMDDIVTDLLDDGQDAAASKLATCVNQWVCRSACGLTFPCEFCHNSSSLNAKTLFNQFQRQVMFCEAMGRRVHGFGTDAGGSNAGLFAALREWKTLPSTTAWIDEDLVRLLNPFDPRRHICVWHCTTHLQKSLRNTLFSSGPKLTRCFKDRNGLSFGMPSTQMLHELDQQLTTPKTELTHACMNLNNCSKMNATLAKAPFRDETLAEFHENICKLLGMDDAAITRLDTRVDAEFDSPVLVKFQNRDGNAMVVGRFFGRMKTLRQIVDEMDEDATRYPMLDQAKRDLSTCEHMIVVHDVFVDVMMNKHRKLFESNVDTWENHIRLRLDWLESWKEHHESRRPAQQESRGRKKKTKEEKEADIAWEKEHMAVVAWRNLRITLRGHFGCVRTMLSSERELNRKGPGRKANFVTPMHSNTSHIESMFSTQRLRKCENANTHASGMNANCNDPKMAKTAQRRSQQCNCEDDLDGQHGLEADFDDAKIFKKLDVARRVQEWQGTIASVAKTHPTTAPALFMSKKEPIDIPDQTKHSQELKLHLIFMCETKSYLQHLCDSETFRELASLACASKRCRIVVECLKKMNLVEAAKLGIACRRINERICGIAVFHLNQIGKGTSRRSFEMGVHHDCVKLWTGGESDRRLLGFLQNSLTMSPESLLHLMRFLYQVFTDLLSGWTAQHFREQATRQRERTVNVKTINYQSEVQRFVGWAIRSCHTKVSRKAGTGCDTSKQKADIAGKLRIFLAGLSDCMHHADQFIDMSEQILNRGGMTLVRQEMHPGAKTLIARSHQRFNTSTIEACSAKAAELSATQMLQDPHLKKLFRAGLDKLDVSLEGNMTMMNEMHDGIVLKTFHARVSAELKRFKEDIKKGMSNSDKSDLALRIGLKAAAERSQRETQTAKQKRKNARGDLEGDENFDKKQELSAKPSQPSPRDKETDQGEHCRLQARFIEEERRHLLAASLHRKEQQRKAERQREERVREERRREERRREQQRNEETAREERHRLLALRQADAQAARRSISHTDVITTQDDPGTALQDDEDLTSVPPINSCQNEEDHCRSVLASCQGRGVNMGEVVSRRSVGNQFVSKAGLLSLQHTRWLKDEPINCMMALFAERDDTLFGENMSSRSHFYKTCFMSSLLNIGHANPSLDGEHECSLARRFSHKAPGKDTFALRNLLIPINTGNNHWTHACVFMTEQKTEICDSLGCSRQRLLEHMFRYSQDDHLDKKGSPLPNAASWTLSTCSRERTPQQENGCDCGVFTIAGVDSLSTNRQFTFGQGDMPTFRFRIALSITTGSLRLNMA